MTNTKAHQNEEQPVAVAPLGRVVTSFSSLPDFTEEEQASFIGVVMENAVRQYQRWKIVEPYTIFNSVKNTGQTWLGRLKLVTITTKSSSIEPSPSGAQGSAVITAEGSAQTAVSSSSVKEPEEDNTAEEGWVLVRK